MFDVIDIGQQRAQSGGCRNGLPGIKKEREKSVQTPDIFRDKADDDDVLRVNAHKFYCSEKTEEEREKGMIVMDVNTGGYFPSIALGMCPFFSPYSWTNAFSEGKCISPTTSLRSNIKKDSN